MLSCGQGTPSAIAEVGRLAPGHRITELQAAGYGAVQAISGVLYAKGSQPLDTKALAVNPALASLAALLYRTNDMSMVSCNYRLADNPTAKQIAAAATQTMLANGVLTEAELQAESTIFFVTDDPTNPN
ncbi:MAG: hypothetical protein DLM71_10525 [Chloroflexi bacterium]|nr:MAG: hypothetical protein DLM71_10525 [Chloroflexota bacterium]